jgi:hypothetical protein
MSNPSEEDWKRMSKLVDSIFQRPDAGTLRRIVEYRDVTLRYAIMLRGSTVKLSYGVVVIVFLTPSPSYRLS